MKPSAVRRSMATGLLLRTAIYKLRHNGPEIIYTATPISKCQNPAKHFLPLYLCLHLTVREKICFRVIARVVLQRQGALNINILTF